MTIINRISIFLLLVLLLLPKQASGAMDKNGYAGGAAGYWATTSSTLINGINSPILKSAVVAPLAAGAGHIAGGTTANLIAGQNLGDAFANSFEGLGKSMAINGAIGVAATIGVNYANGINPWTGKALNTPQNTNIQFGNNANQEYHAFRHTDELGLGRTDVANAIEMHLQSRSNFIEVGKPFNQVIVVNGQAIQYTAYKLPNGIINIGRIHGIK